MIWDFVTDDTYRYSCYNCEFFAELKEMAQVHHAKHLGDQVCDYLYLY
jgi:hypothetical protein